MASDHGEAVVQARTQVQRSLLFFRMRRLFVLHDDLHSLTSRCNVGPRGDRREVGRELAHEPAVGSRILGESGSSNQDKQQAQAFSPSCAVTLISTRALSFQSVQHKSHLSCLVRTTLVRTNVARKLCRTRTLLCTANANSIPVSDCYDGRSAILSQSIWVTLSFDTGRGTVCPAGLVAALTRFGSNCSTDKDGNALLEVRMRRIYRAVAVSAFRGNGAADGCSRGIAAISCWVYACCGSAKIRAVAPHSTTSP